MKPIILNLFLLLFATSFLRAQDAVLFDEIRLTQTITDYGLTGKGTIVAIIDRGIDYRHPDFINPDGTSRILYIVDLLNNAGANDPNNPLGRGTIFTNAQINQALQQNTPLDTRDAVGHGHITAGIAAGNGRGSNGAILGIAPEASIISVKITGEGAPAGGGQPAEAPFNFIDSHLIPVIDFINTKAAEEQMPVAMIANFGSIQGPMDGTSAAARALDQRFGNDAPGRAFISGSSDDGGVENHAGGTFVQGQTISLEIGKVSSNLRFDMWHHEDDVLEIEVVTPTQTYTAITSPANNGAAREENAEFRLFYQGSNVDFFGSTSPRKELLIDFSGPNGVYKLNIRAVTINNGRFDAVLNPSRILAGGGSRFRTFVEPGGTIWDLATSKNNICPNSYILRRQWTDIDGISRSYIGDENGVGSLWTGSGVGPTQDGRFGIDVSVPGNVNFGAYAEDSFFARIRGNRIDAGTATYGTLAAVSGASPVLTGVVSLMLEADPTLSAPAIKAILQETARTDGFTGAVPNNEWGYGKLDVYAAIRRILGPSVSTKESNINQSIQIMPNPSTNTFTISRSEVKNTRFQLQVFNVNGKLVQQTIWGDGELQTSIDLSHFDAGIYYLSGKSNTDFFVKKLIKL